MLERNEEEKTTIYEYFNDLIQNDAQALSELETKKRAIDSMVKEINYDDVNLLFNWIAKETHSADTDSAKAKKFIEVFSHCVIACHHSESASIKAYDALFDMDPLSNDAMSKFKKIFPESNPLPRQLTDVCKEIVRLKELKKLKETRDNPDRNNLKSEILLKAAQLDQMKDHCDEFPEGDVKTKSMEMIAEFKEETEQYYQRNDREGYYKRLSEVKSDYQSTLNKNRRFTVFKAFVEAVIKFVTKSVSNENVLFRTKREDMTSSFIDREGPVNPIDREPPNVGK